MIARKQQLMTLNDNNVKHGAFILAIFIYIFKNSIHPTFLFTESIATVQSVLMRPRSIGI